MLGSEVTTIDGLPISQDGAFFGHRLERNQFIGAI